MKKSIIFLFTFVFVLCSFCRLEASFFLADSENTAGDLLKNGTKVYAPATFASDNFTLSDVSYDKSYVEALGSRVIAHSPKNSGIYIGSPAITKLPNGDYLASHDYFGAKSDALTYVYRSTDNGLTWAYDQTLNGIKNTTMFVHNGATYAIGYTAGAGQMRIVKSADNGKTWSQPTSSENGIIFSENLYSNAPQNVVIHNNRIWYALNDVATAPAGWGRDKVFMMSAPVDADLLKASSWTRTNHTQGIWEYGGWLEPCAVVAPNGKVQIMARVDYRGLPEKSALLEVDENCTQANFNPQTDYFDFPGGCKKFTVQYDEASKLYWTLSNYIPKHFEGKKDVERSRNILALCCSENLKQWKVRGIVLQGADIDKEGFQYVNWMFEGNDIIAAVRTGYADGLGGADNCHNSNFMTFHRIADFRNFITPIGELSDETPIMVENFDDRKDANYTRIRENSNLSSEFSLVKNPDKSGINMSDSCYMMKRSKNDYWEAGVMLYLKQAIPKDKKYMHVMLRWEDKATSFVARFYGSDKSEEYVSGTIPSNDKMDFTASSIPNPQMNTWTDVVIPVSNFSGKDFKYILLVPDRNKGISSSSANYYTYYIDEIVFSNEAGSRTSSDPDCEYYGCTEPDPNEWGITSVSETEKKPLSLFVTKKANGLILDFESESAIKNATVSDLSGRIVAKIDNLLSQTYFVPLGSNGVYIVSCTLEQGEKQSFSVVY